MSLSLPSPSPAAPFSCDAHALNYFDQGTYTFPVGHDKKPKIERYGELRPSMAVIAAWAMRFPKALIGCSTRLNGIFVLDVDDVGALHGLRPILECGELRPLPAGLALLLFEPRAAPWTERQAWTRL